MKLHCRPSAGRSVSRPMRKSPELLRTGAPLLSRRASGGRRSPISTRASLLSLPVCPLPRVLYPTGQGTVQIFEPEYVALFEHLLGARHSGTGAWFVHVLHPTAAPPALLAEGSVGGLPRVGCCAEVKSVRRLPEGRFAVEYEGVRRVRLVMLQQEAPFKMAAAEWYDDWTITEAELGVGELEARAMAALQEVVSLTAKLRPPGQPLELLPEAVQRYAPPPSRRLTSYDALKRSNHVAAAAIDTWRRQGSVYDKPGSKQPQYQRAAADPYEAMRQQLGGERRRELFSFACAGMVDLDLAARLALLLSQDTGARLQYMLAAVQPHLQQLRARAAVKDAVGGGEA